jgi:hypothetical protein
VAFIPFEPPIEGKVDTESEFADCSGPSEGADGVLVAAEPSSDIEVVGAEPSIKLD